MDKGLGEALKNRRGGKVSGLMEEKMPMKAEVADVEVEVKGPEELKGLVESLDDEQKMMLKAILDKDSTQPKPEEITSNEKQEIDQRIMKDDAQDEASEALRGEDGMNLDLAKDMVDSKYMNMSDESMAQTKPQTLAQRVQMKMAKALRKS